MNNTFLQRFDVVTAAVAFDQHSVDLVRMSGEIARRAGKKLCLLHVVEPWLESPHSKALHEPSPLWDVTQAVERNATEVATARLEELKQLIDPSVKVTTMVVAGKPAEALGPAATELGTALLVIGADLSQMRLMPRGFSTPMSLMVSSPVPLLVVDTSVCASLPADGWRLLVADDLSDQTQEAVQFAFDLAAATRAATLHHLHINGLNLPTLRAGIETAAATAHSPINPAISADEVFAAFVGTLKDRLAERAMPMCEYLEAAGGEYVPLVASGTVGEEIERCVKELRPDIVVFGRHQAYHRRPFFIGRLPFHAMLAQRRPVIVVPFD